MRLLLIVVCSCFLWGCQRVDVVIPAGAQDLATLNLSIRSIKKYGQNIGRIVVISSEKLTDEAEWVSEDRFPFSQEDVVEGYRGLLKWYAPCVIKGLSQHILMLDPEVIFCRPVSFLSRWGVPLYDGECPSQCLVSQKILEQEKSWRALVTPLGHFSFIERYFKEMRENKAPYQLRPLTSKKGSDLYKEHAVDFMRAPPEVRQGRNLIFVVPREGLNEGIKGSLERLKKFNPKSEILVVGEGSELKKEGRWLDKWRFSGVKRERGLNVLEALHQVVEKYDLHDSFYVSEKMMVYENFSERKMQGRLAGSLSKVFYIKNKEALRPLIQFVNQGRTVDEYAAYFGKGWIDPYLEEERGLHSFLPYVTSWGFRSFAKWSYESVGASFDPSWVREGDIVYVKGSALKHYMQEIHPYVRASYVLLMLGGDKPPPDLAKKIEEDPRVTFLCQGVNLPLGLPSDIYATGQVEMIQEIGKMPLKREYLFSIDRGIKGFFDGEGYHWFEGVSYREYLLELKKSQFVFCSLNGEGDSHQIWEALYMGAIPVVCASKPSVILKGLPVIYVRSMEEITQEFLEKTYEKQDFLGEERLFLPYWKKNCCKKH